MSDWIETPPRPVLAVQYPWKPRHEQHVYCVNCYKDCNRYAKTCPSCGIVFTGVATAAAAPEWQEWVAEDRPDLVLAHLRWG